MALVLIWVSRIQRTICGPLLGLLLPTMPSWPVFTMSVLALRATLISIAMTADTGKSADGVPSSGPKTHGLGSVSF